MANIKVKEKKLVKKNYTYTVGRRRTASARVRLFQGKGQSTVNGMPIEKYFPGPINKYAWSKPFQIIEGTDKYHVTVKVAGGGMKGQLDAVVHGISKAISKGSSEFRKAVKRYGLLTRDARIRERRKVGRGGKARRKRQSPKR